MSWLVLQGALSEVDCSDFPDSLEAGFWVGAERLRYSQRGEQMDENIFSLEKDRCKSANPIRSDWHLKGCEMLPGK